jgi:hypothetical protein
MNNQIWAVIIQQAGSWISQLMQLQLPRNHPIEPIKFSDLKTLEKLPELPTVSAQLARSETGGEKTSAEMPVSAQLEQGKTGTDEKNTEVVEKGKACLPCTIHHLATCSGLLDEAYRMNKNELDEESGERVLKCFKEIGAAERVDLAPDSINKLSKEEQVIAKDAAIQLREIRHGLEDIKTPEDLKKQAAAMSDLMTDVYRKYSKLILTKMTPEEKQKLAMTAIERLEKDGP